MRPALKKYNVDWDKVPFGTKSDAELGRELGVPGCIVKHYRTVRCIPGFSRKKKPKEGRNDIGLTAGEMQRILDLYGEGVGPLSIAVRVGTTHLKVLRTLLATNDKAIIEALTEYEKERNVSIANRKYHVDRALKAAQKRSA